MCILSSWTALTEAGVAVVAVATTRLIGEIVDIDPPMVILGTITDDDNEDDCVIKTDSTNDNEETTATITYTTSISTADLTK